MQTQTFLPPESLEEAEARRAELLAKKLDIEAGLRAPNKTGADGRRLSGDEYWSWRHSAIYAKRCAEREMAQLKIWITDERAHLRQERRESRAQEADIDPEDPASLIRGAYAILSRLSKEDLVSFNEAERSLIASLRYFLSDQ